MAAECFTRCLASSQGSRHGNCSTDCQRLGLILGRDGNIKSPSWSHSGPVCLNPYDVRPPKALEYNYKKITYPAINHRYKTANTYH